MRRSLAIVAVLLCGLPHLLLLLRRQLIEFPLCLRELPLLLRRHIAQALLGVRRTVVR